MTASPAQMKRKQLMRLGAQARLHFLIANGATRSPKAARAAMAKLTRRIEREEAKGA